MFRFLISAIALAGVLATAQPVFADPLATTPDHADRAQAAAGTEQVAAPGPASSWSSDTMAPVGMGWG